MFRLNPQTLKKLRRFRQIKRGYYSFLVLAGLLVTASPGASAVLEVSGDPTDEDIANALVE